MFAVPLLCIFWLGRQVRSGKKNKSCFSLSLLDNEKNRDFLYENGASFLFPRSAKTVLGGWFKLIIDGTANKTVLWMDTLYFLVRSFSDILNIQYR